MKKLVCVTLALLQCLLLFSGCSAAEEADLPLKICIDIEYANDVNDSRSRNMENAIKHLLNTRWYEACREKGIERPGVIIEYLPSSGSEREIALEKIRTEVMAGDGPDVFLIYCNDKDPLLAEEAIFAMPEKAMELSIFLTLDEYMENNTVFAEWDRMNQAILAAGRTDEGQQVIPLCYKIPVAIYKADEVQHTPSKEITWMDMLESEDKAFRSAAVWTDMTSELEQGMPFMLTRAPMTEFILGGVADYKEEELLFSEEELGQRFAEIIKLADLYQAGEFDSAPVHYNTYPGWQFDDLDTRRELDGISSEYDAFNGIQWNDAYSMIPLYSDDGGVTAEISAYAAINRNTRQPEDAFLFLDYLSSYTAQRSDHIYQTSIYTSDSQGRVTCNIPIYDELMSKEQRIYWVNSYSDSSEVGWYMTEENFAQLCAVRDQITHIRFRNIFDIELTQIYRDYYDAIRFGGDPNKVVADGYQKMQMMLSE